VVFAVCEKALLIGRKKYTAHMLIGQLWKALAYLRGKIAGGGD